MGVRADEAGSSWASGDRVLGRYTLRARIGAGASATAWRATDEARGVDVALKALRDGTDAEALVRELELLRGLRHPHLVEVFELELGARPFLVSRLVRGAPLDAWASGRSDEAIVAAARGALRGLAFLHSAGVRHGDLKPANVLVDDAGHATLIDLGCAAALDAPLREVSGTPAFMAPELLDGRGADARSDLYAFGATLDAVLGAAPEWVERLLVEAADDRPGSALEVLEQLGARAIDEVPAPSGRKARMIGRDAEIGALRRPLEAALARLPGPRVLALEAEDGMGRSRLLRELSWRAQRSARVEAAWPGASRAIHDALSRATGAPVRHLEDLLLARERLARAERATVLVVDDVHQLEADPREALAVLTRLAGSEDALVIVVAGRPGSLPELGPASTVERLGPLSEASVTEWARGLVAPSLGPALHRATGGRAVEVEATLSRLAVGAISEAQLDERALTSANREPPEDVSLHRALAALAVREGRLDDDDAERLEVGAAALLELQRRGCLRRSAGEWRVVGPLWPGPPSLAAELHRAEAERLEGRPTTEARARAVWHLARAGDPRAVERFEAQVEAERAPRAWARAALEVAELEGAPVAVVDALVRGGRAREALGVGARMLAARPDLARRAALRLALGQALLSSGAPARAAKMLARAEVTHAAADVEAPSALHLETARARLERGDYAGAAQAAERGLELTPEDLGLRGVRGSARAYLGQTEGAARDLDAALAADATSPRARSRLLGYRAIVDFRRGHLEAARRRHEESVALAEDHSLGDVLATAALNLGTVQQQLGDWGGALESYARAARVAGALGRESTRITVEHNLANLHLACGQLDRATHQLERVEEGARALGLGHLEGPVAALRGELAAARGDADGARRAFLTALATFEAQGATREQAECALEMARLERGRGAGGDADAWLERAEGCDAEDVRARCALERGRRLTDEGRSSEAVRTLEGARAAARTIGEPRLLAQVEAALAEASARGGASALAESHRSEARALLERIALTLPEVQRAAFFAANASSTDGPAAPTRDPSGVERLLEINTRLNSTLSTARVLEHAIDAAIELTGAERGFILERRGEALEVSAARNLDRERVGRSHLKFSHSIAEGVISSGQALLTTDARHDARFASHESVHAMRLTSIVCVPIASPRGVLGAIYLDNRFERGRFDEDHLALLSACADQIALALENARLVGDLEARTRELEAEQARVRELLVEREAEIERLESAARERREPDRAYPAIVGRSRPMRDVLSVVDRVVDSALSVVIEGESGTGKELIARAIHDHGPRAGAPLLAINCGALPDPLLEGELFGWKKGAFTGADQDRDGVFVQARGGTVFLDEVGETSAAMQTKLLRVLQQRELMPLGSTEPVQVDVRVVAATNRRLRDEVAAGRFREDLFYRLAVVEIELPPLRARREDLAELTRHLLARHAEGEATPRLHPDAMRVLMRHEWPGNVRELENVLSRALVMGDGQLVRAEDLGLGVERAPVRGRREHEAEEEREILAALTELRWNVSEVSRKLGIPRTTLYRKMDKYGIARG